jgi:hypothetical protein
VNKSEESKIFRCQDKFEAQYKSNDNGDEVSTAIESAGSKTRKISGIVSNIHTSGAIAQVRKEEKEALETNSDGVNNSKSDRAKKRVSQAKDIKKKGLDGSKKTKSDGANESSLRDW